MKYEEEQHLTIQVEDYKEARRLYNQLICIPLKHRKEETRNLIERLHAFIDQFDGWEE